MLYSQSIKKNILYNYRFPNKQGFAVSKKIRPGYYIYEQNFIILMYEFDISFSAGFSLTSMEIGAKFNIIAEFYKNRT